MRVIYLLFFWYSNWFTSNHISFHQLPNRYLVIYCILKTIIRWYIYLKVACSSSRLNWYCSSDSFQLILNTDSFQLELCVWYFGTLSRRLMQIFLFFKIMTKIKVNYGLGWIERDFFSGIRSSLRSQKLGFGPSKPILKYFYIWFRITFVIMLVFVLDFYLNCISCSCFKIL
jgi:hypothetical protein